MVPRTKSRNPAYNITSALISTSVDAPQGTEGRGPVYKMGIRRPADTARPASLMGIAAANFVGKTMAALALTVKAILKCLD